MSAPAPARLTGTVPAGMTQIADEAAAELGLPGLALAGGGPGTPPWLVTKGWADLDRGELLGPAHRWPAYCGSALVTATAVLCLVAEDRVALDRPVNDQIRTVRLEDAAITVRELLTHTGGVDSPAPSELLADSVPDLASVTGPVVGCSEPAWSGPAQQRRLRRARPARRRRHRGAVCRGRDPPGAGAARADRVLVPGPRRGPQPGRGDRLHRDPGRHLRRVSPP